MIAIPKIEITITTKTPIWTGNYDREMVGVKETGIMGSLRWWYEAILRGFGCYVCDPTNSTCSYNVKRANDTGIATDGFYEDNQHGVCVCPACQIFGCTGWSKQFRMRWYEDEGEKFRLKNARDYRHNNKNDKGYYTCSREDNKERGACSAVFYPQNKKIENILKYLILFLQKWGGFGARPQFGYGICDINEKDNGKPIVINDSDTPTVPNHANSSSENIYPDLRDFFFCEFEPNFTLPSISKTQNYSVDAINYPVIETKYQIRNAFRNFSPDIRHFICGDIKSDKISSRIFISRRYKNVLLIRGYIPKSSNFDGYDQKAILEIIRDTLGSKELPGNKKIWTAFDPNGTNSIQEQYQEWLKYLIAKGETKQ